MPHASGCLRVLFLRLLRRAGFLLLYFPEYLLEGFGGIIIEYCLPAEMVLKGLGDCIIMEYFYQFPVNSIVGIRLARDPDIDVRLR